MPETQDGISVLVSTMLSVLQRKINLPASLCYVQGSNYFFPAYHNES